MADQFTFENLRVVGNPYRIVTTGQMLFDGSVVSTVPGIPAEPVDSSSSAFGTEFEMPLDVLMNTVPEGEPR